VAKYRQVHVSFWQDSFVLDLTPEEKYFYIYLMTNTRTSACGVYEIPKKIMEIETGYNRETVDKLIHRFVDYGKIKYSEETDEIFLLNWLKYNNIKSINTQKCIEKEISQIKCEEFIPLIRGLQGACKGLPIPYGEKEKEKEKENKHMPPSGDGGEHDRVKNGTMDEGAQRKAGKGKDAPAEKSSSNYSPEFEKFWQVYPRKTEKKKAYRIWNARIKTHPVDTLVLSAQNYAADCRKRQTDKGFIKHPSTFLGPDLPFLEYVNSPGDKEDDSLHIPFVPVDEQIWGGG
jgi:hypothetical protein